MRATWRVSRVKKAFKYLKLPEAEEFTIQTKLSKTDAIAEMGRLTEKFKIFTSRNFDKARDPKFVGDISTEGFVVYLAQDVIGQTNPFFHQPRITGVVLNEQSVSVRVSLEYTKFQKVFHSVWTCGALLFPLIFMLVFPVVIFLEIWGSAPTPLIAAPDTIEAANDVSVLGAVMPLVVAWLLPLPIVAVFFIWLPRRMIVRTKQRSKALMIELYTTDRSTPN